MATPSKNKTNFKTYEASVRLLAAVLATNNVKLDYAALAGLVGEGATAFALQHRMRPIVHLAKEFSAELKKKGSGKSPDKAGEIHKLFGESTPDGIEWQFRSIKHLSKAQQEAVKKGENPATLPVAGTPSGRKRGAPATTPGSRGTVRTPATGAQGRKRKVSTTIPSLDSSDENVADNDSDNELMDTPSKRLIKRAKTTTTTMKAKKVNGSDTTPLATPIKTTSATPTAAAPTAGTPTAPVSAMATATASATRVTNGSIFGDAGSPAPRFPGDAFDNGVHMSAAHSAQYTAPPTKPVIKTEFAAELNQFFPTGGYDNYEDGEI
ncbi:hypothetical protein EKO27_g3942 [Xylaria grammica]|uniref:Uncharacterized protein n=1 Tax=Xylaria grammica TaxID=363999 RepID=A0A439D9T4_9PEZI|nr:hypothetical protein EKO27_g3942 [Xylaria grammica]